MHNVLRFADSLSFTLLEYLDLHYFGDATESLCPTDTATPEPPVPDFLEVFPNPYCTNFFVKLTDQAPAGNGVCEVYDFYGNLLKTKPLEQGQALEIVSRNPNNVLLLLRRDGEVADLRAVMRLCR